MSALKVFNYPTGSRMDDVAARVLYLQYFCKDIVFLWMNRAFNLSQPQIHFPYLGSHVKAVTVVPSYLFREYYTLTSGYHKSSKRLRQEKSTGYLP